MCAYLYLKINRLMVDRGGIEPPTRGFSAVPEGVQRHLQRPKCLISPGSGLAEVGLSWAELEHVGCVLAVRGRDFISAGVCARGATLS